MSEDQQVPPQYKCPICGKWGRSMSLPRGVPNGYLFCNPKARRGGKGCGEIFKHIRIPACTKIVIPRELSIADRLAAIEAMGYKLLDAMKASGKHKPLARTCEWNYVYSSIWATDGTCDCGCGRPKTSPNRKFASTECGDIVYSAAAMIASQGNRLRQFLVDLRGESCEKCKTPTRSLEVDHILEVSQGGGLCWIDNFQLLCQPCHKDKTAAYATVRAKAAREQAAIDAPPPAQLSLF